MQVDKDALYDAILQALKHDSAEVRIESGQTVALELRRKIVIRIPDEIPKIKYIDIISG